MPRSRQFRLLVAAIVLTSLSLTPAPAAASAPPRAPATGNQASQGSARDEEKAGFSGRRQVTGTRAPTPAFRPLTVCSTSWRVVADQERSWNSFIGGIGGISPIDMWAVGKFQSPTPSSFGSGDLNMAEHWDGTAWSVADTPNPGPDANDLSDLTAIATNDVWAVGGFNTTGFIQSEAVHWNGVSWSGGSTGVVTPGGGKNLLNDVTGFAMDNVWAVGYFNGDNGAGGLARRTLIEHWTGSSWSQAASTNVGSGDNDLFGIGGTSASDIWAVGYSSATPGAAIQGLILHYNGSVWSTFTTSGIIPGELSAVAADSPTHAF